MNREQMLDFLKRVADGLAVMFGSNCEAVIHDMENEESSVLYIANSHVTGRKVGDRLDLLGVAEVDELFTGTDLINMKGVAKNSQGLKCSTFHARGKDYHFALGIKCDYTSLAMIKTVDNDLSHVGDSIDIAASEKDENLEGNLDELYKLAIDHIGKPIPFMRKKERVEMIKFLYDKGTFSIHKSIPIIAGKMNISRYTIYNY